jgi:hypothetical protein
MLLIHLRLGLPSGLFPSGFPTNKLYTCHMSRPPHPPRLYNSNYTWGRVQIMKLLVMQLFYEYSKKGQQAWRSRIYIISNTNSKCFSSVLGIETGYG